MTDSVQRFLYIRSEITHEDGLIAQRLSWFLTSQSFLLSGLAIAHRGEMAAPSLGNNFFFPLVPIVGLLTTTVIFISILSGLMALHGWRRMICREATDTMDFPRLPGEAWINFLGSLSPLILPVIFFFTWVVILWGGVVMLG